MSRSRAKAASEGAAPDEVKEAANLPTEAAVEPEGTSVTTIPPLAPAASSEPAPALPSQFQDHAHNAITLVQIKRDELQSHYNQVKAEMDGTNQAYEAMMAERRLQFETEQNRAAEMHAENQDKMKKLLQNLEIGLTTFEAAITTYNDLMQPIIENMQTKPEAEQ